MSRLATLGHELKLKKGSLRVSAVNGDAASPVVAIRPPRTTARAPLFLIHPVGGSVIAYYQLANYLHPDQPVYAVENQVAFRPGLAIHSTIEEMAAAYLREVRAIYPKGPLNVGGYSMGGAVSFEMARQARDRGDDVATVSIIDTPARLRDLGDPPEETIDARELALIVRMMASRVGREIDLPAEQLEPLPPEQRLERVVEVLKREEVLGAQSDAPLLRQLLKVVRNNELAQRRYLPRAYDGELLLLRASDPSPELLAEAPDVHDDPDVRVAGRLHQTHRRRAGERRALPPAESAARADAGRGAATASRSAAARGLHCSILSRRSTASSNTRCKSRRTRWRSSASTCAGRTSSSIRRANRIAARLRALGVGPETIVAIQLERGPRLVAAMLGVLKAGGAYLPLDPRDPEPRLRALLQDARPAAVIDPGERSRPLRRLGEPRRPRR